MGNFSGIILLLVLIYKLNIYLPTQNGCLNNYY